MTLLREAQIGHSIQLNAMKPNELIGHHQVQSTVLGTGRSTVFKTRSCPLHSHNASIVNSHQLSIMSNILNDFIRTAFKEVSYKVFFHLKGELEIR